MIRQRVAAEPWIARDEPSAFTLENPNGKAPILLACDHASSRIPARLGTLGLAPEDLLRHIAWDIGAAEVARHLMRMLDATLVLAGYSRLVIDCNRPLHVEDAVAPHSEDTPISGNHGVDTTERDERAANFYWPYHDALHGLIDERVAAGGVPVLVCVHSFTPVYRGRSRPWHVGVNYRTDARVARSVLAELRRDETLVVGENEPYDVNLSGDYTAPVHAERRGLPYVLFEIRQDLIGSPSGALAWAERLAAALRAALEGTAVHAIGEPAPDVREPRYD